MATSVSNSLQATHIVVNAWIGGRLPSWTTRKGSIWCLCRWDGNCHNHHLRPKFYRELSLVKLHRLSSGRLLKVDCLILRRNQEKTLRNVTGIGKDTISTASGKSLHYGDIGGVADFFQTGWVT